MLSEENKISFQGAENRGTGIAKDNKANVKKKIAESGDGVPKSCPGRAWRGSLQLLCDALVLGCIHDSLSSLVCPWRHHYLQPEPTSAFVYFRPLFEDEESEVQRRCRT